MCLNTIRFIYIYIYIFVSFEIYDSVIWREFSLPHSASYRDIKINFFLREKIRSGLAQVRSTAARSFQTIFIGCPPTQGFCCSSVLFTEVCFVLLRISLTPAAHLVLLRRVVTDQPKRAPHSLSRRPSLEGHRHPSREICFGQAI